MHRSIGLLFLAIATAPALAQIEMIVDYPYTEVQPVMRMLVPAGDHMFLRNSSNANGFELWKTDGTAGGTALVKDIWPGTQNGLADTDDAVLMNGVLYFAADDGVNGIELWRSDGTEAGTQMVIDLNPGPGPGRPTGLAVLGGTLLFRGDNGGSQGFTLWASDGTAAGTFQPRDLGSDAPLAMPPGGTVIVNGPLAYFPGSPGPTSDWEMWTTDGTLYGNQLLADACPGMVGGYVGGRFGVLGEYLFYAANDCASGWELWMTNGSPTTTIPAADVVPGPGDANPHNMVALDGILLFSVTNNFPYNGVYRTNGTQAGTYRITEALPEDWWQFSRQQARRLGNKVYFSAYDDDHGYELWSTDGETASLLMDINAGTDGSLYGVGANFWVLDSSIYFVAETPVLGSELWVTDGTAPGTVNIQDRWPGTNSFAPDHLVEWNGYIYMTGSTMADRRGLFRLALGSTGLPEGPALAGLTAWPNPNAGHGWTVDLTGAALQLPARAEILDALGRVLHSERMAANKAVIGSSASLGSGTYRLRVTDARGTVRMTPLVVAR